MVAFKADRRVKEGVNDVGGVPSGEQDNFGYSSEEAPSALVLQEVFEEVFWGNPVQSHVVDYKDFFVTIRMMVRLPGRFPGETERASIFW